MAKPRKKKREANVYVYRTSIKVVLVIFTLIFAAMLPITWRDKGAWANDVPLIFLALIVIVLYFSWVLWQDGKQKYTITKEGVHWEKGRWIFRKDVEIPFADVAEFKDTTTLFSISRKYAILSNDVEQKKIPITSAPKDYREMLQSIIKLLPKGVMNERTRKSLTRARYKL